MSTADPKPYREQLTGTVFEDLVAFDQRIRDLERKLYELTESERAHARASQQDARDTLARGDTHTLVVLTPPENNDGSHAVSKYEGIYTFVEAGPIELHRGDLVRTRIVDVGDSHAEALALECPRSEVAE